ncbi:hypothetical protein D3C87_1850660 [compost metagenome]
MLVALGLEQAQVAALLVDVAQLLGEPLAQGLDIHFEPAGGEREFGAQLILVGAEFGHGDGRSGLDAALGEAHRPLPYRWQDDQRHQARHQQA